MKIPKHIKTSHQLENWIIDKIKNGIKKDLKKQNTMYYGRPTGKLHILKHFDGLFSKLIKTECIVKTKKKNIF